MHDDMLRVTGSVVVKECGALGHASLGVAWEKMMADYGMIDHIARRHAAIETEAGIDPWVAQHINAMKTSAARNAIGLLKMAMAAKDHPTLTLLKAAVSDCKKEMSGQ